MKIEMSALQKALEALRGIETYDPIDSELGTLGTLRAKAFCARSAIEARLGLEMVEVES